MQNFFKKRLRKFMLGDSLLARAASRGASFMPIATITISISTRMERAPSSRRSRRFDRHGNRRWGNYIRLVHKLPAPELIVSF
jgi:hypothetical protein